MVIGFSSVMGTRRRINMAEHRRSIEANKAAEEENAWEKMAKEVQEEASKTPAAEKPKPVEKAKPIEKPEPPKWEELSEEEKVKRTAEEFYSLVYKLRIDSILYPLIENAPLGGTETPHDRKERITSGLENHLKYGLGYKDISKLRKAVEDSPEHREKVAETIQHITETDANQGESPLHRILEKVRKKSS
jgi:hypothetical protein